MVLVGQPAELAVVKLIPSWVVIPIEANGSNQSGRDLHDIRYSVTLAFHVGIVEQSPSVMTVSDPR